MNTKSTINNMRGFTLVELMIVVLLTAIAVIAIYRGYTAFSQFRGRPGTDHRDAAEPAYRHVLAGKRHEAGRHKRRGRRKRRLHLLLMSDAVEFTMDLWGDDRWKRRRF